MTNSIYLNKALQTDNVFVENSIINFNQLTGLQSRRGYEKAVISNGKLVNVVSNSYGHLPNEKFFYAVEEKLIDADLNYDVRSIKVLHYEMKKGFQDQYNKDANIFDTVLSIN